MIKRFGVRNLSVIGILIAAAGMGYLTQLPVNGSYAADLLPGLIPMSIGMGITFVPITLLGTGGVRTEDAGLASGLFNTAQQVGGSLGLAILSTAAATRTSNLISGLGPHVSKAAVTAARVSGYDLAFAIGAGMLAAGALIMLTALRPRHVEGLELETSPSAVAA
jgi:hypothetical protein